MRIGSSPNPITGSVINGRRDRRRHTRHSDFPDAARSVLVHDVIGIIKERDVEIGQICTCSNEIIGEAFR